MISTTQESRKNFEKENEVKASNQTLEEQAIINILKNKPTTTQEEIAIKINKSLRTVKSYMAEMQDKGLIERKNSKKNKSILEVLCSVYLIETKIKNLN
ncbi:MAG: winged helix-turn-helix domain-containing protein [Bacilli bacterium]|nr:winged helix-turn-helix domain-containing protein [Bacilli bacterium]